ncbi:hypothetical protein Q8A73_014440 [Channa argus]|nr:hypothetical protein Q8A73_014440 [Channa argus]
MWTVSDWARDQDLGPCSILIAPPEPTMELNFKEPTLREMPQASVESMGHKGRQGRVIWRRRRKDFSIVVRMTEFLLPPYIDTSVQEGGFLKVPGLSSIILYRRKNKLQIPFSSLSKEFMVFREGEMMLSRDSDTKVSSAGIQHRESLLLGPGRSPHVSTVRAKRIPETHFEHLPKSSCSGALSVATRSGAEGCLSRQQHPAKCFVVFIKPGERLQHSTSLSRGLLAAGWD